MRSDASTPSQLFTAAGLDAFVIWISCSVPETETPPPEARRRQRQRQRGRARTDHRDQIRVGHVELVELERPPSTVSRPANSIDALPLHMQRQRVVDVEPERQAVMARAAGVVSVAQSSLARRHR